MLYMNKATGEVLSKHEMLEQFRDDYDGDDPTNPLGWGEYFDEIPEAKGVETDNGHSVAVYPPDYMSPETEKVFVPEDMPGYITLDTFPDADDDYCKKFIVEKKWMFDTLQNSLSHNENEPTSLENFLYNYVWEETEVIYNLAKQHGKLVKEWQE